jgi:TRAP-type C4-dicarboxylate transport system permease small subunit
MILARTWKTLNAILERTASIFYGFGSGVLAVLMVFTFVDVALRYFFNSPIKGDYELSSYMMVLVIPSGLALTALKQKHIRVDVLTQLLPQRVQSGLSTFAYLIALGFVGFMVWQTAKYASLLIESRDRGEAHEADHSQSYADVDPEKEQDEEDAHPDDADLIGYVRLTVRGGEEGSAHVAS